MSVIVFPGQGSQFKGMGAELFEKFPELTQIADNVLGYSIKDLCLEDPENNLNKTQYTQPALFTVNALHYFYYLNSSEKPDYIAGHSLGEYNALLAASVFDFESGLKLVQKRGQLMSKAKKGAMLAIARCNVNHIKKILSDYQLDEIDIANHNSTSQIVISASVENLSKAKQIFDNEKIFNVPLKASGAFHSRHMRGIAQEFKHFLSKFEFNDIRIPVIANVTGRTYQKDSVKELLARQITSSVQWTDSIRFLMAKNETDIKEIGPGKVLTGLNADILKNAEALILDEEIDNSKRRQDEPLALAGLLGSAQFKTDYGVKYAYTTGSMCNGIASKELVIKMAKAGFLSFFGTAGLSIEDIEKAINSIKSELNYKYAYGMNVLYNAGNPEQQEKLIELFLRHNINNIEVSGFNQISIELVKYRLKGLKQTANGELERTNKLLVKTSKPEVAKLFMQPAPKHIVNKLLAEDNITRQQASLSFKVPMADDICVEGDPGWRTTQAVTLVNLPEIIKLRDAQVEALHYHHPVRIGAAGGLGTPEAIAAVFTLGADFVVTGSINQCTVEANIGDHVKELLEKLEPQDICHAPAGELFESGSKVQVVRKDLFFPTRAQKLYDLYRLYGDLNQLDVNVKKQLEEHYFKRSLASIFQEIKLAKSSFNPEEIQKAEKNPKYKMALIFKWYFEYATKLTMQGTSHDRNNCQIYSSSAMGAFNQWVKGSDIEKWRNRHVDEIAIRLLENAAKLLINRNKKLV